MCFIGILIWFKGSYLKTTAFSVEEADTTRYVLDSGSTLTSVAGETSTFYLYGYASTPAGSMGVIGTLGESWSYILPDGAGSTRQLVTPDGAVALSIAYTPWGDTLEIYGSGMLNLGYLGGVYDAGTGLIYMGNGQYYDPSTGRFLTRGAKPEQSNPYTPWNSDPAGMLVAPLALLVMIFGYKKNKTKFDQFIILLVIAVSLGLSVSACNPGDKVTIQVGEATITVVATNDINNDHLDEYATEESIIPENTIEPTATINPYACEFETVIPWNQMFDMFRVTKEEISQFGSMENYLRQEINENPALTLVRVSVGESSNKDERIRIMWLIMIKKILGFNNTDTRSQLGSHIWDNFGVETTFEKELLEPNSDGAYQFEDLHVAFKIKNPELLDDGNLKYMFYPNESEICDYLDLYAYAKQITQVTKESIKTNPDPYLQQVKGYDSYLAYFYEVQNNNFDPTNPKAIWGLDGKKTNFAADNPDPTIYEQLNVWRDNYPIDNVFFGLVSCQTEKQVVDAWWQAYGTDSYLSNLFHDTDINSIACP